MQIHTVNCELRVIMEGREGRRIKCECMSSKPMVRVKSNTKGMKILS
jgi:hypothetical protein